MAKPLLEKQALKKVGIKGYCCLSKGRMKLFASILPDMPPEGAKALAILRFRGFHCEHDERV